MKQIEKTVFISYRRTNAPWALAIYQHLHHNGYDVFFDYNSIPSGSFERVIFQNILARAHFIILLSPTSLQRCEFPDDWLRREIEYALDTKRNIIPIMLEGFNFAEPTTSKYLTGKLELLQHYNGMTVPVEFFDAAMSRLRETFLSVPLNAVLHPLPESATKSMSETTLGTAPLEMQYSTEPIQISPLFISYSHSDSAFVDKLEEHLNKKGIRFWRDIHHAKAGRLEKQIDRAIRDNSTVLLILSENSVKSDWVEHEVATAREVEKEIGRDVLCPVALDKSWKESPWSKRLMRQVTEYNILDFSSWKNDSAFHTTFEKLIDGLELFY